MEIKRAVETDLYFICDLKDEKDIDLVIKAQELFNRYWDKNGVHCEMIMRGFRVEVNINFTENK